MSPASGEVKIWLTRSQAKENADDLLAEKRAIDAQVDAKRKEAREAELAMRQKAGTIGNIVNKGVPVSQTEVYAIRHSRTSLASSTIFSIQDDNLTLKTWHPNGPNGRVEKQADILAHHEVLLRLDAMDLERGTLPRPISAFGILS